MKKIRKIIAILFILAISALAFSSCMGQKQKIIASYGDKQYVYEDDADFLDFYNLNRYFHSYETGDDVTNTSEYNNILSDAVKETIIVRVFEEEMEESGYTIDMDKVRAKAEADVATFNAAYDGGFEQFCKDWSVSKDVFLLYNRYEAMREIAKEYVEVEVSESEAVEYYNKNPEKYFKTPHYDVRTIFLQITEPSNTSEMAEAYDDAMLYIEMLNSGRSWESVKETAFIKYGESHGTVFTERLTGLNHVYMKYFLNVMDIETAVYIVENQFYEEHGMTFKEMFPGSFEDYVKENELLPETKEYNKALETYMTYSSVIYNIEFEYAIKNYWREGTTYYKPIYHAAYDSFVVVTFDRIEEEEITISFDEAKEDIMKILTENKKDKEVDNYISQRMSELKVKIEYK